MHCSSSIVLVPRALQSSWDAVEEAWDALGLIPAHPPVLNSSCPEALNIAELCTTAKLWGFGLWRENKLDGTTCICVLVSSWN